MEPIAATPVPPRVQRGAPALAVASLVLGILGLLLSVIVVGAVLAVVGLGLGAWHLRRRRDARGLGWVGVWLSVMAIVASVGFAAFYAFAVPRWVDMDRGLGPAQFASLRGKPAPELDVVLLDGSRWRLSDHRGRRVIIDFWATWCGPCVQEIPHFNQLQRETGTNALVIVGVSREDRAVLKRFADTSEVGYSLASVATTDLEWPYADVRAYPTTFFVDEAGVIREVAVGYSDLATLRSHAGIGGMRREGEPASP